MTGSSILRTFLVTDFRSPEMPFACAVSAYDQDDALDLVRATYAPDRDLPRHWSIEELTPEEIQRRIGNFDFGVPVVRGIWYPHLNNP
jgi:hypothetical protein